jgi:hypothetical protein
MAAELRVKLCRSIEIDRLILAAEMVLQELLALSYVPTLGIEEVEGGVCYPTTSGSIGKKDQMFVVRFRGYDEAVAIVVYEISLHLSVPESEVGFWASVSVGAMRTPLEYVLAAGVAVALARVAEADVIDDSL